MDGDKNHDEKGLRIPFYTLQNLLPIVFVLSLSKNELIWQQMTFTVKKKSHHVCKIQQDYHPFPYTSIPAGKNTF